MNLLRLVPFRLLLWYENRVFSDYSRTFSFATGRHEGMLRNIAHIKLEHAFSRALKTPAYIDFLKKRNIAARRMSADSINRTVPVLDKNNYIKKYSYEQRCVKGRLPEAGNIDESAGSSGKPTNWVRDASEDELLHKAAYFEYKYSFRPTRQVLVVSAWSTGPWATGIKFCELVEHFSLIKNAGPDEEKIKTTLKTFGNNYQYIIAGYPFFLQLLFESDFPWKKYDIDILTGGDGYSSQWPKRIKQMLKPGANIVSAYGCSDIDIGVAFETGFTQEVREEATRNKQLSKALFGDLQTAPMVFQYNPTMHYIHNLDSGEFAITHLDVNVASPKIKYNVHDLGGSIPFSKVESVLKETAPDLYEMSKQKDVLRLPFLFVVGRSDGTVSFDGANVFPEQLDMIFSKHFGESIERFKIVKKERRRYVFHILAELKPGVRKSEALKKKIAKAVAKELPRLNSDYAESLENNKHLAPVVGLYTPEEGPFKMDDKKIKYSFFVEK